MVACSRRLPPWALVVMVFQGCVIIYLMSVSPQPATVLEAATACASPPAAGSAAAGAGGSGRGPAKDVIETISKKQLLQNLRHHSQARIARVGPKGVGVVAISAIYSGTDPFLMSNGKPCTRQVSLSPQLTTATTKDNCLFALN